MKPRFAKPLQIIALCLASAHLVNADSATWNGTTDATWEDVTNWSSDPNPVPGSADTATFANAGNANTTIDLGAGVTISSILFDTVDVASYTIGSGGIGAQELILEDSGSIIANNGINANQIINANLTLGGDGSAQSYAVTNSDNNNSITFAGTVTGGTGGIAGAKTLDINHNTGVIFSGIIADGGASSLAIQKSGSGNLTLTGGVSTLTGGINVSAGMLTIAASGSANNSTISLGAAGNTGTAVRIGVVNSATNPSSPIVVVEQTDGEPTQRLLSTSANTSGQWSGPVTMNDDLTVGALNTSGTNVYNFTLNSSATVNLGANTLTLQSTSPGNVIAKGKISGTGGNLIVSNTGTGIAIIEGTAHDYTGTTTITAGTLQIGSGAVGSIANTSSISNSGVLDYKRTGSFNQGGPISGTGLVRVSAAGTVTFDKANTYSGTTTIGNGGKITVATGGSMAPTTGAALTLGNGSGSGTLQYDSAETSKFAAIVVGNGTSNTGTLNQTAGTINGTSMTLNNGYSGTGTGTVNLSGGTMTISGVTTVSSTTTNNTVLSSIAISNAAILNANGGLNLTGAPVAGRSANGKFIQDGGTVTIGGATGLLLVRGTTGNTATRLGQYELNVGTLNVNTITNTSTGAADALGTFNFNGGTLKPTASSPSFWDAKAQTTANIKDGGAKIDTAGFDITIGQPLLKFAGSTTDTLTKDGPGKLTLAGTNTYTGATTVNAGTLEVSGSLDATDVEVKNDGTLAGIGSLGGNVTVRTGGRLAFGVATTAGSQVPLTITGSLDLEAGTFIDLTAASPPAPGGPYVLLTATGGITGSVGSVTLSGLSGSVVKNGNNLELTVTAPAGFAAWAATPAFGLAVADQDPTDDPDNDGMDNLLEFVLNGNPSVSDPSILPDLVVTATDFEFTYQRRDDSVSPETTQTFQWGTTLATWPGSAIIPGGSGTVGDATVTVTVSAGTPDDGVTDTVKISIPKTEDGGSGKLFGRLQVTKP